MSEGEAKTLARVVDAVRQVHAPIDALICPAQRIVKVCTGCGTDDGNWQRWPCPTIRVINEHAPAVPGGESNG